MVGIEILVFESDGGVFYRVRYVRKRNLRPFFFAVDIIEKVRPGAVIDLGRLDRDATAQVAGTGQIFIKPGEDADNKKKDRQCRVSCDLAYFFPIKAEFSWNSS